MNLSLSSSPERDAYFGDEIQVFARHQHENTWEDEFFSVDGDDILEAHSLHSVEQIESFVEEINAARQPSLLGSLLFWTASAACVVAIMAMALSHIWAHGQATRLGFVYSQSSKKAARLKEDQRLLKLQLAKLRNPKRLAQIARMQLGMRLPHRSQVISEDRVIRQLQRLERSTMPKRTKTRKPIHLASHRSY